jgi:GT2 family glycosyltransferase
MSTRSASVVIPSNGRAEALRDTLDGLRRQDHPAFEVIVVVGPDDDGYDDVRAAVASEVRWLSCDRRNVAAARNVALRWAAGEVIACIDDDAIPDPWWLGELDRAFDDPEVAACGGPVLDASGVAFEARHRVVARSGVMREAPAALATTGGLCSPESWLVPFPSTVNCAYRRSALLSAGGFDEGFALHLEGADLAVRLADLGWRVVLLPTGCVYHRALPTRARDADGVTTDWSHVLGGVFRFAQVHGMRPGCVARTWAEVSDHLDEIRRDLAAHVDRGAVDKGLLARLERDIEAATDRPLGAHARPAPSVAPTRNGDGPTPLRAYPSWGRTAQQNGGERRHLCLVLEDDRQRMAAERLARDLVTWGDIVRVIRRGRVTRVHADKGLWYHDLAVPEAPGDGLDAFWSACRDEMSRIDRMHPLDEWSSAGGDGDPGDPGAFTRQWRDGNGSAAPGRSGAARAAGPGGALWDPGAHP